MAKTIKLGQLIRKTHIKFCDFNGDKNLEVLGVSNIEGITRTTHKKSADLSNYLLIKPNSFAYNPYRINVGSIGLTPSEITGIVSPAYIVFQVDEEKLIPEVLLNFLKSDEGLRQINHLARGTVRKALRYDDLCEIDFPNLSFAKQEQLVRRKAKLNTNREILLSEISHQETLLAKLKQAILQEAIQGRLTADWRKENPDVESAGQLLERIQNEMQRLIAEKKIRKEKPPPPITPEEIPFEIPDSWEWCRLGTLIEKKPRNGISLKPVEYKTDTKTLKLSATSSGTFDGSQCKYLDLKVEPDSYLWLRDGDILIQRANSLELVGTTAVYRGRDFEFIYPDLMMKCRTVFLESTDYLHHVLSSQTTKNYFQSKASGSAGNMPKVSQTTVIATLIPLPPLGEQIAITKRVKAFMNLCRQLETEIKHSRTNAENLLQAVLKEAFTAKTI